MKVFIRTLFGSDKFCWGTNWYQREQLRIYLNGLGFYVLSGKDNSLNVYAIKEKGWWEKWL
jgi:hypothetical protein